MCRRETRSFQIWDERPRRRDGRALPSRRRDEPCGDDHSGRAAARADRLERRVADLNNAFDAIGRRTVVATSPDV